ncbi:hypothetical protein Trco_003436 [Trichoderma cornu-damae]|uniref:Uncharacterized protein n=1 Tax=Trichoderma cornu-damae TaxID=654480 RepID=A0A9P8QQX0_9HYPO|nr:hypothetical protein Trco_003436 [Trichoderma cornu-damae]
METWKLMRNSTHRCDQQDMLNQWPHRNQSSPHGLMCNWHDPFSFPTKALAASGRAPVAQAAVQPR